MSKTSLWVSIGLSLVNAVWQFIDPNAFAAGLGWCSSLWFASLLLAMMRSGERG